MSELPPSIDDKQDVYAQEVKEKGLNNFYSDVVGGYRRVGFTDELEMLTRKDPSRRMGKSIQEYWKDVDNALIQTGIDEREVSDLQEQIKNNRGNKEDLHRELDKLLAPAYIYLRELGYTQWDIWS